MSIYIATTVTMICDGTKKQISNCVHICVVRSSGKFMNVFLISLCMVIMMVSIRHMRMLVGMSWCVYIYSHKTTRMWNPVLPLLVWFSLAFSTALYQYALNVCARIYIVLIFHFSPCIGALSSSHIYLSMKKKQKRLRSKIIS